MKVLCFFSIFMTYNWVLWTFHCPYTVPFYSLYHNLTKKTKSSVNYRNKNGILKIRRNEVLLDSIEFYGECWIIFLVYLGFNVAQRWKWFRALYIQTGAAKIVVDVGPGMAGVFEFGKVEELGPVQRRQGDGLIRICCSKESKQNRNSLTFPIHFIFHLIRREIELIWKMSNEWI